MIVKLLNVFESFLFCFAIASEELHSDVIKNK